MKSDLFHDFLAFEEKEHLFDIEYQNFKIWEIARGYIYIEIDKIYHNLQPLFPQQNNVSKRKKINISTIKHSLKIFFLKGIDYIFLNNPRRVMQGDGKYHCVYTDLLCDLLKKDAACVTFEDPYWALSPSTDVSHFEPVYTKDICYLDSIEFIYSLKKFFFLRFSKREYQKFCIIMNDIKEKVETEFACDLSDIFKVIEGKILYLVLTYPIYKKCIQKASPKAIFEFYDIFPSKIVVNKIAKELSIPIIEIQHGIVTKRNPIFLKYGNMKRRYDCLPDYVLSYGEKLLNRSYMPIKDKNIFYIGNLFLAEKLNEYRDLKSNKKNILFVSQSNLGSYLSKCAATLAELLKNNDTYHIIYKMHPYEIGMDYDCLKKENITVINNRDKDLYYYQAISIAQVGVYSTGLYEGLNFGLNTFLLSNCYGFDEVKDILKEDNSIFYVKTAQEIYDIIKRQDLNTKKENDYWSLVDDERILKIIYSIAPSRKYGRYLQNK